MKDKVKIQNLIKIINTKKALIGLIGVGYVGSAIGISAAQDGFTVIGFGRTKEKVESINAQKYKNFIATTNIADLSNCNIILICVPTPVFEDKSPNLNPLKEALKKTSLLLKKKMLIVIESSISVGHTRNIALPILEESSLKVEKDFYLAFSPERIDPGNKIYKFRNIPKVVAGIGDNSKILVKTFYEQIVDQVIPVSTIEAAEMVKLLENTFRLVNISLVNELREYTKRRGLDIREIINAAETKPFGFLPHYPGPGIGGHCIPVDPYYLFEDAKKNGVNLTLIKQSGIINDRQPKKVVQEALFLLKKLKGNGVKKKFNILLLGISYKKNVDDTRESPALAIWKLFEKKGHKIFYHDPYINKMDGKNSIKLTLKNLSGYDLIIVTTNHDEIDYKKILKSKIPILDTRNFLNDKNHSHVYKI